MNLYSIAISPTQGIGLCYVTIGETPKHALATLSFEIRKCLKAGVNPNEANLLEVLRVIRKPWRTESSGSLKVEIVPCKAVKASYDTPLIPWSWGGQNDRQMLTLTCNHHDLIVDLSPRQKPSKT